MKILFVTSEVEGVIKTGGLADFSRALPAELMSRGHDVRIITPRYLSAENVMPDNENFIDLTLDHSTWHRGKVCLSRLGTLPLRLIEHHHFFSRTGIYDDGQTAYDDNPLRFAFLSKASVIQCLIEDWIPDIIHCNDWQTALSPFYLNVHFAGESKLSHTRSVLTIHNGSFQGKAEPSWTGILGIPYHWFDEGRVEHDRVLNVLKCGIYTADKINAVSQGYRNELLNPPTSHGLSYCYEDRKKDFAGILNGCDYRQWHPGTDVYLAQNYSMENISGKTECKKSLQQRMGLPAIADIPVFGMVSRLTDQKGLDYLIPSLEQVLINNINAQFIILGAGNREYADHIELLTKKFDKKIAFYNGYEIPLSHQIEAGADFFMMPSLFEPCGLNQLYSMAYGTLPIVRLTGGLKDTVVGLDHDLKNSNTATGITFNLPGVMEMIDTLNRSVDVYVEQPELYRRLQHNAMAVKFGWNQSARAYESLYDDALRSERRFL